MADFRRYARQQLTEAAPYGRRGNHLQPGHSEHEVVLPVRYHMPVAS